MPYLCHTYPLYIYTCAAPLYTSLLSISRSPLYISSVDISAPFLSIYRSSLYTASLYLPAPFLSIHRSSISVLYIGPLHMPAQFLSTYRSSLYTAPLCISLLNLHRSSLHVERYGSSVNISVIPHLCDTIPTLLDS